MTIITTLILAYILMGLVVMRRVRKIYIKILDSPTLIHTASEVSQFKKDMLFWSRVSIIAWPLVIITFDGIRARNHR